MTPYLKYKHYLDIDLLINYSNNHLYNHMYNYLGLMCQHIWYILLTNNRKRYISYHILIFLNGDLRITRKIN